MKLKHIAAAALAVVGATSFAPAFAAIEADNNPELFLVAFDTNVGSYVKDTGIHLSDFLGASGLANTSASNFSQTVGPAYAAYTALNPTNVKWALLATDGDGTGDPFDFSILTTSKGGGVPAYPGNGDWSTNAGNLALFLGSVAQTGTHTAALAVNGESFNAKGTAAYYDDTVLGNAGTLTANPVGVTSPTYWATNSSYDSAELPLFKKLGGIAAFDGTTVSYTVPVVAVPEADGLTMAVSGLGLLAFVARRRRRG